MTGAQKTWVNFKMFCIQIVYRPQKVVSSQIRDTTADLDSNIILIFQRVVKNHLLLLRDIFTASIDNFAQALPEEMLGVFNQCLCTVDQIEVPFIFIDNVLLKQVEIMK